MKRLMRPVILACFTLVASMLAAQEMGRQEDQATMIHMHEHLDRLTAIKAAILLGSLEDTREPARWLAEHEPMANLPVLYEPFVLSMRKHAEDVLDANDIEAAALGVSAIANDCAGCHMATDVNLAFGYDDVPSSSSDRQAHMQRHLWAVDRLWEGLIGPSDAAWSRGIKMMAEEPLFGTEAAWDGPEAEGDELAKRVHELGRQAAKALTPDARGRVYSQLINTCSDCHQATGGGPGS